MKNTDYHKAFLHKGNVLAIFTGKHTYVMANETDDYLAPHYLQRSNWLRAAVLGANDGILSTASLAIGIAAASDLRAPVVLATVAGLVAGALSMAAGEYVSVSSQTDVQDAEPRWPQAHLLPWAAFSCFS